MSKSIASDRPVKLAPVDIAKPWGREIWYSGIEARGESAVVAEDGVSLPLSEYLAAVALDEVLLLKVLDPSPEEVVGDLYFEVHDEKKEVYVVTDVDQDAWPDGVGAIRFGMSQSQRSELGDDGLREKYMEAVAAYADVRRRIDREGDSVDAAQEAALRHEMETFTNLRKLRVGDVVHVPTMLPHSLQHGVRVVEFQTPTYERQIISFAQKVVTQDHWDFRTAIPKMRLDVPPIPQYETIAPGVERIATFSDFNVWRVRCADASQMKLPDVHYAICMAIGGRVTTDALALGPGEACLLPTQAIPTTIFSGGSETTLLVAAPGL